MKNVIQQSVDKLHGIFEKCDLEAEARKIQKKIEEARYNPGDIKPLVDCIFSLLLAARSRGYTVDDVMRELEKVAEANLKSSWKKMPDGTYQTM
jgi:hypothetical protein